MSENDIKYHITMYVVKDLLNNGLITNEEYEKINADFIEKYKPLFEA